MSAGREADMGALAATVTDAADWLDRNCPHPYGPRLRQAAERLTEGTEWFWRIVDAMGPSGLPSDEEAALWSLCRATLWKGSPHPAAAQDGRTDKASCRKCSGTGLVPTRFMGEAGLTTCPGCSGAPDPTDPSLEALSRAAANATLRIRRNERPLGADPDAGMVWPIEIELPCINGLSCWFALGNLYSPDTAARGYTDGVLSDELAHALADHILRSLSTTLRPSPPAQGDRERIARALVPFVQHTETTNGMHRGGGFDAIDWRRRDDVIDAILALYQTTDPAAPDPMVRGRADQGAVS